jgi:hypothetical protein
MNTTSVLSGMVKTSVQTLLLPAPVSTVWYTVEAEFYATPTTKVVLTLLTEVGV